jgi:hypothetical protein
MERLNYLSVLSAENDIIKSSYEEAKSMQPKNLGGKKVLLKAVN